MMTPDEYFSKKGMELSHHDRCFINVYFNGTIICAGHLENENKEDLTAYVIYEGRYYLFFNFGDSVLILDEKDALEEVTYGFQDGVNTLEVFNKKEHEKLLIKLAAEAL